MIIVFSGSATDAYIWWDWIDILVARSMIPTIALYASISTLRSLLHI